VALERLVAIKLLPPALAGVPDRRQRFLREARTAAQLAHPNIVPIHAVEEHRELVFFVMGYVDGETLGQRTRRAGPLPSAELIRVVQEVAWALDHAHARGVVHRDMKPDNVRSSGRPAERWSPTSGSRGRSRPAPTARRASSARRTT
jgi:serine/threonine-protein kinase